MAALGDANGPCGGLEVIDSLGEDPATAVWTASEGGTQGEVAYVGLGGD